MQVPRVGFLVLLFVMVSFVAIAQIVQAVTSGKNKDLQIKRWFVAGNENDNNRGTTLNSPFASLQKAACVVQPGDTVLMANGIYKNSNRLNGGVVLRLTTLGTKNAWTTLKALPGHKPEIKPTGWAGINIGACYLVIAGLKITGANDSIVLHKALEQAKVAAADPFYNTNGIFIEGRQLAPEKKPHHVIIRNCTVSKCPDGGLAIIEAGYITVEDCEVYQNGWYMRFGGSGISILNNRACDDLPGYHIIIKQNKVWNNKTMVPCNSFGKLSDGNGILLHVTDLAKGAPILNGDAAINADTTIKPSSKKPMHPRWKGRALIANNLSVFNGGSGIHAFRTKHVDITYNITYRNGQAVGYQKLFPNNCKDVVIMNNIMMPRPGNKVTFNNRNTDIRWDYNVYPAGQDVLKGPHHIVADPKFNKADDYLPIANFNLLAVNPALNSGTKNTMQLLNLQKSKRPKAKGIDRGC